MADPAPVTSAALPRSLQRGRALVEGDRVAVLAISGPIEGDLVGKLDRGLDTLRAAGLHPIVYPSCADPGSMFDYLAGDDALRAGDLRGALLDPDIAGIVFAAGGYGAHRTLAAMDWSGLDQVPAKVLAGFSDVTGALEAVAVRLGWASLFSAMVTTSDPYSVASLLRCLLRPGDAMTLHFAAARPVVGGRARGITMGGTLALLAASLGTDTSWRPPGGIVLLEDQGEAPYRIDRMLTQLRRSGYFDQAAAVITGAFYECGEPAQVDAVLRDRLGDLGVPVLTGANIGHGGHFQAFPIGIAAELDADGSSGGELRLLDPPLVSGAG